MRAPPRRAKATPAEERRADVEGCGRWAWSWAMACARCQRAGRTRTREDAVGDVSEEGWGEC